MGDGFCWGYSISRSLLRTSKLNGCVVVSHRSPFSQFKANRPDQSVPLLSRVDLRVLQREHRLFSRPKVNAEKLFASDRFYLAVNSSAQTRTPFLAIGSFK